MALSRTFQALSNQINHLQWSFLTAWKLQCSLRKAVGMLFVKCSASTNVQCQWISGLHASHLYTCSFGWKENLFSKDLPSLHTENIINIRKWSPASNSRVPSNPFDPADLRHSPRSARGCFFSEAILIHWSVHVGNRNRHRRSCPISPRKTKDGMWKAWNDDERCCSWNSFNGSPVSRAHFGRDILNPTRKDISLLASTCSTTISVWALKLPCQKQALHLVVFRTHFWGSPVAAPDPPQRPSNMDTNQEATNRSQIRRWTKSTSWPDIKRYEQNHQDHQG